MDLAPTGPAIVARRAQIVAGLRARARRRPYRAQSPKNPIRLSL